MFSVDYPTLAQIIRQFMYTGTFRASVGKSRFVPEDGYIELQTKEGVITACQFVTKQGKRYVWERWNTELAKIGVLNWEQIAAEAIPFGRSPSSESLSQPSSSALQAQTRAPTPYHTFALTSQQIQQLPMSYRRVYSLIDGKRQMADIALMLHKSEQEVVQVINELVRQELVLLK